MQTFEYLVNSRREWIDSVLKPWCQQAKLVDLKKANDEWLDIAGKVDASSTLWTWAWSRFPDAVYDGLTGIDETNEVRLTLQDGTAVTGFPDNRASGPESIVIWRRHETADAAGEELGPYSIDEIVDFKRIDASATS